MAADDGEVVAGVMDEELRLVKTLEEVVLVFMEVASADIVEVLVPGLMLGALLIEVAVVKAGRLDEILVIDAIVELAKVLVLHYSRNGACCGDYSHACGFNRTSVHEDSRGRGACQRTGYGSG